MRISINPEFLSGSLDDKVSVEVLGFAYAADIGNDEKKPTYYLFNKGDIGKRDFPRGLVVFFPYHLFEQYFLKDRTINSRTEIICISGQFKKGEQQELPRYGIAIEEM